MRKFKLWNRSVWGDTHYRVLEKNIADVVAMEVENMDNKITIEIELIDENSEEEQELRKWREE